MKDKRIFVPGGAGSIGSELVRQLAVDNEVYILDINETLMFDLVEELRLKDFRVMGRIGDIKDKDTVTSVFLEFQPHVVFNCAALKHVTPSMQSPREYVKTNVLGTLNLLECSREFNTEKFINISSDKAVNSDNVMGWTKRGTEVFTKIYGGISVRFGNVLGSRGSVIPIWQRQADNGEPLTITDPKMKRYMMSISQAASLVIEASKMPQDGRTIILDMGQPVKILELAREIIERSGGDLGIKEIGIRPGETLSERLMTEEEEKRAIKKDKFWII